MLTSFQIFRDAVNKISPIGDKDWQLCEPGLELKTLTKSAFYVEEGKVYREIGFVVKGLLRSYYLVEGEDINTAFYMEGQWPKAYHSFLTQTPGRQWIQALENSELITISYKHLQYLFTNSPAWERFGRIATENLYVVSLLMLFQSQLHAQNEKTTTMQQTIIQLHSTILKAVKDKNSEPLHEFLKSDFIFTSATAELWDKNKFINGFALNPSLQFPEFAPQGQQVIFYLNTP